MKRLLALLTLLVAATHSLPVQGQTIFTDTRYLSGKATLTTNDIVLTGTRATLLYVQTITGNTGAVKGVSFPNFIDYAGLGPTDSTVFGGITSATGSLTTLTVSGIGNFGGLVSATGSITTLTSTAITSTGFTLAGGGSGVGLWTTGVLSPTNTLSGLQLLNAEYLGIRTNSVSSTSPFAVTQADGSGGTPVIMLIAPGSHTNIAASSWGGDIQLQIGGPLNTRVVAFTQAASSSAATGNGIYVTSPIYGPTSTTSAKSQAALLYLSGPIGTATGFTLSNSVGLAIATRDVSGGTVTNAMAISATAPTGAVNNYVAVLKGNILHTGGLLGLTTVMTNTAIFNGPVFLNDTSGVGTAITGTLSVTNLLLQNSLTGALVVANGGSGVSYTLNPTLTGATINGNVTVTGTFTGSGSITASGNQTLLGTFTVTGASTHGGAAQFNNNVTITGSLTSSGNLTGSGNMTLLGTLTMTGAQTFGGAMTLNNNLTSTGNGTFTGNLSATGNLILTGTGLLNTGVGLGANVTSTAMLYVTTTVSRSTVLHGNLTGTKDRGVQLNLPASYSANPLQVIMGGLDYFRFNVSSNIGDLAIDGTSGVEQSWRLNGTSLATIQAQTAPSAGAILMIGAGTNARAPLIFTSGTLRTTLSNGAFEYDGTNMFGTLSGTRGVIITATNSGAPTNTLTPSGWRKVLGDGGTHFVPYYD